MRDSIKKTCKGNWTLHYEVSQYFFPLSQWAIHVSGHLHLVSPGNPKDNAKKRRDEMMLFHNSNYKSIHRWSAMQTQEDKQIQYYTETTSSAYTSKLHFQHLWATQCLGFGVFEGREKGGGGVLLFSSGIE